MINISIIGVGYVGLVSGVCFAEIGHNVTCIDINKDKIDKLKKAEIPIYEPGLKELIKKNQDHLNFTTDINEIKNSDCVFIAVGTPTKEEDGSADLQYIYNSVEQITKISNKIKIIIKSTVPVGTCKEVSDKFNVQVISNPEFLREGCAIEDFLKPDRVVIGTIEEDSKELMAKIYKNINAPILYTSCESSELIKYASNAFLATKIAFINEIADLCENSGADINDIALGIGLDNRIGPNHLKAGPGYGGSCFPKDTLALSKIAQNFKTGVSIIDATIKSNENRKDNLVRKISAKYDLEGKKISVLGLAFKANTDDIRYSPAINIIRDLKNHTNNITAYDPEAMEEFSKLYPDILYANNIEECYNADILIIVTEWEEFKNLDFKKLKEKMTDNVIFDFRNLYIESKMIDLGFKYYQIGKKQLGKNRFNS